jgi:hypothetical protein
MEKTITVTPEGAFRGGVTHHAKAVQVSPETTE